MNRKKRTELLIKDRSGLASDLAEEIRLRYPVVEVKPPQEGLTMIKLREQARNTLFYLGEILITEAKVRINGHSGLGLVCGNNSRLAADLAVIDAACNGRLPESERWEERLITAWKEIVEREEEENGKILETKVNFASMQEEDYI